MKTENNEITISVTLNGSEVSRNYLLDDVFSKDAGQYGNEVLDMLGTLSKEDKTV